MNLFLQKAWLYFKKYWWILLLGIAAVLIAAISSSKGKMILDMMNAAIESVNREKEELERIEEEKEKKKEEIKERLATALTLVEQKAEAEMQIISDEKKQEVTKLVKLYSEDQATFNKKFEEMFGIKYVGK